MNKNVPCDEWDHSKLFQQLSLHLKEPSTTSITRSNGSRSGSYVRREVREAPRASVAVILRFRTDLKGKHQDHRGKAQLELLLIKRAHRKGDRWSGQVPHCIEP